MQDEMDKELAEMLQRNQKRLAELHSEFKVVSKLTDEPYVNVRKIKQPGVRRRENPDGVADKSYEV